VAAAASTAFTYQGQLKQDGVPANGEFDFRFRLLRSLISEEQCVDNVLVVNGLFEVSLDFGSAFDNGVAYELDVAVRPGGALSDCFLFPGPDYTTLSPRQPITPAPYAIHAFSAPAGHSLDAADGSPRDALGVDGEGNVGIGTNPTAGEKLHVAGDARFDGPNGIAARNPNNLSAVVRLSWLNDVPRIRWGGSGVGSGNGFDFQRPGEVSLLRIANDGKLGILTSQPETEVDARSASSSSPSRVRAANANADTWVQLWSGFSDGANDPTILWSDGAVGDVLRFGTGAINGSSFTEHMRITGTGRLGLGAASPQAKLHVFEASGLARIRVESADNQAGISFVSNSTVENVLYSPGNSNDLRFFINGADRVALTSAGAVGIGTNSPQATLHVAGEITANGAIRARNPADASTNLVLDWGANSIPQIRIAGAGWAGFMDIVDDAGQAMLRISRSRRQIRVGDVDPWSDDTFTLGDSNSRWQEVWAANPFIQTSDRRLKRDIQELNYGLSAVLALHPVSFRWVGQEDDRTQLGLIAQEVEPVVPEAVRRDADPNTPWAMTYTTLVPVLVKAIQEQQATIERLTTELAAHRGRHATDLEAPRSEKDAEIAELRERLRGIEAAIEQLRKKGANGE